MRGEIRVEYACQGGHQTFSSDLDDLRGHNLLGLARAVFGYCREHKLTVEAVDISARGPESALAEDRRSMRDAMAATGVTPGELSEAAAWRRLVPGIIKIATDRGILVEPGTRIDLVVTDGADEMGRGQLTLR